MPNKPAALFLDPKDTPYQINFRANCICPEVVAVGPASTPAVFVFSTPAAVKICRAALSNPDRMIAT
jgi:hypothetical protein